MEYESLCILIHDVIFVYNATTISWLLQQKNLKASHIRITKYNETGNTERRLGSGRPLKIMADMGEETFRKALRPVVVHLQVFLNPSMWQRPELFFANAPKYRTRNCRVKMIEILYKFPFLRLRTIIQAMHLLCIVAFYDRITNTKHKLFIDCYWYVYRGN